MSEANERVVEQLRRGRDAADDLSATVQAHLGASNPGELRQRLSERQAEVELQRAALARRLSSLEPRPSLLEVGVTLAEIPLRLGLGGARLALTAVRLPLEAVLGTGNRPHDRAGAHASAEQRAAAAFASLQRVAEGTGDAATAALGERGRGAAERMLSLLERGEAPAPPPPPPARPRARAAAAAPPPPPAAPIPEELEHVSEEPVVVAEFAEQGAEDGAGAEVSVDEPWEGYRRMRAQEIVDRLAGESDEVVAVVQLYEGFNRRRQTVLRAAERRLKVGPGG